MPAGAAGAAELLVKVAMDYLQQFHPIQLIGFGMAYAAILFILLPRISHALASIVLLLTAVNQIHGYQKHQHGIAPLEIQVQTLGIIAVTVCMQLYCMGKSFSVL